MRSEKLTSKYMHSEQRVLHFGESQMITKKVRSLVSSLIGSEQKTKMMAVLLFLNI